MQLRGYYKAGDRARKGKSCYRLWARPSALLCRAAELRMSWRGGLGLFYAPGRELHAGTMRYLSRAEDWRFWNGVPRRVR